MTNCGVCGGEGAALKYVMVACWNCNGEGYKCFGTSLGGFHRESCSRCGGTGKQAQQQYLPCGNCNGTGKVHP